MTDDVRKHCEFGGMAGPVADTQSYRVSDAELLAACEEWQRARTKFLSSEGTKDDYHLQRNARQVFNHKAAVWYQQKGGDK